MDRLDTLISPEDERLLEAWFCSAGSGWESEPAGFGLATHKRYGFTSRKCRRCVGCGILDNGRWCQSCNGCGLHEAADLASLLKQPCASCTDRSRHQCQECYGTGEPRFMAMAHSRDGRSESAEGKTSFFEWELTRIAFCSKRLRRVAEDSFEQFVALNAYYGPVGIRLAAKGENRLAAIVSRNDPVDALSLYERALIAWKESEVRRAG